MAEQAKPKTFDEWWAQVGRLLDPRGDGAVYAALREAWEAGRAAGAPKVRKERDRLAEALGEVRQIADDALGAELY